MKDLKKARKILSKVNTLFESLEEDSGKLASIELDLMRAYLRELYELFLSAEPMEAEQPAPPTRPEQEEKVKIFKSEKKSPVREEPPEVEPPFERPDPAPLDRSKTEYQPPRIIDLPDSLEEANEEPAEQTKPEPEEKQQPATPPPSRPISTGDEEVDELFETPQAKELSEKLSELPISDLTKAMGLNEKIFTINELFGGDQSAFEDTLKKLNTLESFEDAKSYLAHNVAGKYEWPDKSRKKKAKNFIKLVRRRFN